MYRVCCYHLGEYESSLSLDDIISDINADLNSAKISFDECNPSFKSFDAFFFSGTFEIFEVIEGSAQMPAIAVLPWFVGEPEEDEVVTARFGEFGYYGEWMV